MVKKAAGLTALTLLGLWACATYQPPPPAFYIGEIPAETAARFTLDERIQAEDAWKSLREGDTRKAGKILSRLGSGHPLYYAGMGFIAFAIQDLAVAEQYFKASILDHPELPAGHLGLAQIYQETGRGDLAFSEYREVLKSEPEHPWAGPRYEQIRKTMTDDALYDARTQLAGGNTDAGKSAFLRALYFSPRLTEAHLALARLYQSTGDHGDALVHLKAAFEEDAGSEETLLLYGEVLEAAKEYAQSLDKYERLLELDPDNQAARQKIESLKNRLGIFELPSQYDAIATTDALTKEQMAALLGVKLKDVLEAPTGQPPIIIDISTSWASRFILAAASLGILDVYPNHTFQPEKPISRAEMAETLLRLVDRLGGKGFRFIQHLPPERIQIADVSADNFYYRPIIMMISYDIMGLAPGKLFHPDRSITGREAIKLLDIILALIK